MKSSSLTKIIDATLNVPKEDESKKPKSFKPSMLGTKCLRKLYYSYNRVPEDFPPSEDLNRIFTLGRAIDDMLKDIFRRAGVLIDYVDPENPNASKEFLIKDDELEIKKGYIDGVFILNGELWLGEFKSINDNGFSRLRAPKPDHLVQGITYLYLFNRLLSENKYSHIPQLKGFSKAKGIKFIYFNKNNSKMAEFIVTENDNVFKEIVEKILAVKAAVEENVLPPCNPAECKYCPWSVKCKNDYKV